MRVLDLGAYDAILGMDWLKPQSPMVCHWEHKTMEFDDEGRRVKLQGVQSSSRAVTELLLSNF
uniref:Uncharacterized protein n=1 Tax=Arundo donax TaxID=35708 RepID=A0A0A8YUS4_ARUDO